MLLSALRLRGAESAGPANYQANGTLPALPAWIVWAAGVARVKSEVGWGPSAGNAVGDAPPRVPWVQHCVLPVALQSTARVAGRAVFTRTPTIVSHWNGPWKGEPSVPRGRVNGAASVSVLAAVVAVGRLTESPR